MALALLSEKVPVVAFVPDPPVSNVRKVAASLSKKALTVGAVTVVFSVVTLPPRPVSAPTTTRPSLCRAEKAAPISYAAGP
ncbi:hypothetical protein HMP06_1488 [Sphingomonas sp. HMP6]|nr:hypothetical protein HMP06_1488 [Sphingomonas sp. HMP6]